MRTIISLTLLSAVIIFASCTPKLAPGASSTAQGGLFDRKGKSKKSKPEREPLQFVTDTTTECAIETDGDDSLSQLADLVTNRPAVEVEAPTVEPTTVEEPDTLAAPPTHDFESAETEHIKISRYNPFGDNSRFTVNLEESGGVYPYRGKFLSGYGYRGRSMHSGVDLKGIPRDTIRSVFDGTVRLAKPYSGYGNVVVVRHDNGLETVYSHNVRNLVRVGDKVKAGEAVALIGRTGRATTEHCHFELRVQGVTLNPSLMLDYNNMTLRSGKLVITKKGGSISGSFRESTSDATAETEIPTPKRDSGAATTATAASGSATAVAGTDAAPSKPTYHTVVRGDTLSGIAKRYGTTVTKLCQLNGIKTTSILSLKQRIKLQ